MSRGTFWRIVITAGDGAALMFAVKQKIFFVLKTLSNLLNIKSRKRIFFVLNRLQFFAPHITPTFL